MARHRLLVTHVHRVVERDAVALAEARSAPSRSQPDGINTEHGLSQRVLLVHELVDQPLA